MSGKHRAVRTQPKKHALLARRLDLRSAQIQPKKHALPLATAGIIAAVFVGAAFAATRPTREQSTATAATVSPAVTSAAPPSRPPSPASSPSKAAPSRTPQQRANRAQPSRVPAVTVVDSGTCEVSYYDEPQPTASGEEFDPEAYTAAHKTLPFNTRVRVTNLANGKSVTVRINDRGPYIDGRCLDLARAPFRDIASLGTGVVDAKYEVLG